MRPETYKMLANREDVYWWHRARRSISIALLKQCKISRSGYWLDLGCGPGGNLGLSASFEAGMTVGLDVSPIAISIARQKKPAAHLVCADLSGELPFSDSTFDVVTIFNVLYHDWVKSEEAVLSEVSRVLRPGGILLLTEPAFPILAREMDLAAMGHRRYRLKDMESKCRPAALDVERSTYITSFGFIILLLLKAARHFYRPNQTIELEAADMKPISPPVNAALHAMAMAESRLIAWGARIPFGTTLLCLARKRSNGNPA